jgi:predicted metal-binding protein
MIKTAGARDIIFMIERGFLDTKLANGVNAHLLSLKKEAIALGASDVRIIPADVVPIEDEIIEMCSPPYCEQYGKSANCPPHVMTPEDARQWIRPYHSALIFKIDVSPPVLFSKQGLEIFKKVFLISARLEELSVAQGYAFSKGLAAGSCKAVFCRDMPCEALINERKCRYPSLARPSMEALGINVFRLVRDVGWEIHAILRKSDPDDIPSAMLAGLLLV